MKISPKGRKFGRNVILVCLLVLVYYANIAFVLNSLNGLFDFGSFIAAGQLANENKNPYSNESPLIFSVYFGTNDLGGQAPNLNPPISVLIFQGLANINPFVSITIWRIVTIALFVAAVFTLHYTYPINGFKAILRLAWAFSLAGLWHTIQLGQIYTLALLLTVMTWVLLKQNRPILSGIFLGILIAIKPNFILWAILLFVTGNWRIFLSAGLCAASISAIPLATNGFGIYRQWLEATSIFTPNLLLFPGNNSFQGLTARFGSSEAGVILSIFFTVLIIFYVYKTKPVTEKVNALAIVASLFISPIAWTGYTLLTLPIFFERKQWGWPLWLTAGIFSVSFVFPLMLFTLSFFNFIVFGWFYGWGLLCLLGWIIWKEKN
jgi:hypothetical protein